MHLRHHLTFRGELSLSSSASSLTASVRSIVPISRWLSFRWPSSMAGIKSRAGIVLSAFFYGYISTQVLGGWLADRFGGKRVLGIGVLWWSLFTVVTPIAAGFPIWVLILTRVAMGAGEGVMVGSVANVVAHWVRADERARALGLTGSGAVLGVVVAFLLTAPISNAWGWPAAFYLSGALGLVWALLWFQFVTDKPEDHPRISLSELSLIKQGATHANPIHAVPWKKILTTPAVWSYAIEGFVVTWGVLHLYELVADVL